MLPLAATTLTTRACLAMLLLQVGGLLLGGFTSGVGATLPITIDSCAFVNNTPAQPVDTITLQGGGLCIQGPAQDSADDPMSQHGFLQQLSIMLSNTTVEGNVAAEGGGLWTAWPMIIEHCSFFNNTAVVSVSETSKTCVHLQWKRLHPSTQ